MSTTQSSSHAQWDCTYHLVICPKYRKKIIYGKFKTQLWDIITKLLREMKVEKIEWFLCADHIHLQLRIPPALRVASVIWQLKGKSAIQLHNRCSKKPYNTGHKHFWSRGYFIRTTGFDVKMINEYIRNQESQDKLEDWNQLDLNF